MNSDEMSRFNINYDVHTEVVVHVEPKADEIGDSLQPVELSEGEQKEPLVLTRSGDYQDKEVEIQPCDLEELQLLQSVRSILPVDGHQGNEEIQTKSDLCNNQELPDAPIQPLELAQHIELMQSINSILPTQEVEDNDPFKTQEQTEPDKYTLVNSVTVTEAVEQNGHEVTESSNGPVAPAEYQEPQEQNAFHNENNAVEPRAPNTVPLFHIRTVQEVKDWLVESSASTSCERNSWYLPPVETPKRKMRVRKAGRRLVFGQEQAHEQKCVGMMQHQLQQPIRLPSMPFNFRHLQQQPFPLPRARQPLHVPIAQPVYVPRRQLFGGQDVAPRPAGLSSVPMNVQVCPYCNSPLISNLPAQAADAPYMGAEQANFNYYAPSQRVYNGMQMERNASMLDEGWRYMWGNMAGQQALPQPEVVQVPQYQPVAELPPLRPINHYERYQPPFERIVIQENNRVQIEPQPTVDPLNLPLPPLRRIYPKKPQE